MTIALKLLVLDTQAALAAATSPRERASLKSALDGYKRTLDAAVSDPEPRAARAPTVDPETGADDEATKTCTGCGQTADEGDRYCAKCGSMLPLDDEDLAAPDSPPSAEAVRAVVDRAMLNYAGTVNGKPIKVSDLSTYSRSLAMRADAKRDADAVAVRKQIAAKR